VATEEVLKYVRPVITVGPHGGSVTLTMETSEDMWFSADTAAKCQKHDYDFHLPHPDMLDVAKVQEELSMERPLAILEWDGKVGYVFAQQAKDKAKALGIKTGVQKKDWFPDHRHTKQVVDAVRKVVHAPWPNKPKDATCKVTLVEV